MYNVYVISNGKYYKIGIAKDMKARLATLQTGNCDQLTVVAYCEVADKQAAYALESRVHTCLAKHKIRGEWFSCFLDDILKTIRTTNAVYWMIPNNCTVFMTDTGHLWLGGNGKEFEGYVPQELLVLEDKINE